MTFHNLFAFCDSLQEYSLVLSQLSYHINYVCSSTSFILKHTTDTASSPITMATETCEKEELMNQVHTVVVASRELEKAVTKLQQHVYHVRECNGNLLYKHQGLGKSNCTKISKKWFVVKCLQWTFLITSSIFVVGCCWYGNRLISFLKFFFLK